MALEWAELWNKMPKVNNRIQQGGKKLCDLGMKYAGYQQRRVPLVLGICLRIGASVTAAICGHKLEPVRWCNRRSDSKIKWKLQQRWIDASYLYIWYQCVTDGEVVLFLTFQREKRSFNQSGVKRELKLLSDSEVGFTGKNYQRRD